MRLARDTWLTFQYEVGLLIHNPVNVAITQAYVMIFPQSVT